MKRLASILLVALCATVGVARGDTGVTLPSASTPNGPGMVALSSAWTLPPSQPEQLPYDQLMTLWQGAGAAYGVPWQVLAAINKIESNFGRNMGPSSAGAIGWMQFMPSTWLQWGTDASGDGIADPWNPTDAIYSAARYLAAAGGQTDINQAVFAYNHAQWYVNEVLQLAGLYGSGQLQPDAPQSTSPGSGLQFSIQPAGGQPEQTDQSGVVVFALDRLQQNLGAAQDELAAANAAFQPALERAQTLEQGEAELWTKVDSAPLLSDQLDLQKQAVQFSLVRQAAQDDAARLGEQVAKAKADLQAARNAARAASFQPAAAMQLGAPAYRGNWVFPVGGGPETVSVSHFHHDYPAADIAAPEGSPVYALSDAVVLRSWSQPDPRCGIGLTLQTQDGQVWTYCHLSYLDPSVVAGAQLQAGASIGLLGHTGDASGPHLHLQLQPAASYPQNEPWFKAFAGSAFRWQEDAPTQAGATVPVTPVYTITQQG